MVGQQTRRFWPRCRRNGHRAKNGDLRIILRSNVKTNYDQRLRSALLDNAIYGRWSLFPAYLWDREEVKQFPQKESVCQDSWTLKSQRMIVFLICALLSMLMIAYFMPLTLCSSVLYGALIGFYLCGFSHYFRISLAACYDTFSSSFAFFLQICRNINI